MTDEAIFQAGVKAGLDAAAAMVKRWGTATTDNGESWNDGFLTAIESTIEQIQAIDASAIKYP